MKQNTQRHVRQPQSLRVHPIAVGLYTAMLMPVGVFAQTAESGGTMSAVTVQDKAIDPNPNAEVGVPYKARTSGDSRHTRPLAETPQTMTVITKSAIDDSGLTDLKQILSAQPGITLGTGENGNMFGDRYVIRGYEAKSDVFVDGLRDPGMTTRETFAIEQLEISKGPNSSFAGRGTAGGAINAITKQATLDYDFNRASFGLGSDQYERYTVDSNKAFTDKFALRVNALYANQNVPDRAPSSRDRQGLALSGLWEVNEDLSVTIDYYGMRGKDKQPDLGSYLKGIVPNRLPASGVPVYAQSNDFLQSDVDTLTARVNYRFANDLRLTSLTRYGTAANSYGTTGASFNTTANRTTIDSGHTGWQEVGYFAHQSNLRWDKALAGYKHEFIFGVEYTDHKVVSGNYTVNNANPSNCRTATGPGANNAYCISDTNGNFISSPSTVAGRTYSRNDKNQDWYVKTLALSVMDTVDLTDKYTLFGGLRADHYSLSLQRYNNTGGSSGSIVVTNGVAQDFNYSDTLLNGHLGLSYKINPFGMVYASMATSQNINGGEPDSGTSSGYGGLVVSGNTVGTKPETAQTIEIGTKWNLFDDKLLATAAIFQTTKTDVMEGADYTTQGTFNTGRNRVKGVELGLAGSATDKLTLQAGVAVMKSEILASSTASNVGHELANFANQTYSILGKYQLTRGFSFGTQLRHESQRCGGQPNTGATYTTDGSQCGQPVPGFTVYDLFANYRFNRSTDMRVNILNAGNKDYYTAVYRSGSFLYKGDARAIRTTLNVEF